MKKIALLCSYLLSYSVMAAAPNTDLPLMPYPQQLSLQAGSLAITQAFSIYVPDNAPPALKALASRTVDRLERQTGRYLRQSIWAKSATDATLVFSVAQAPKGWPQADMDESYRLNVSDKQIRIDARQLTGAMRAVETLLQLERDGQIPAVSIEDAPRFAWRGASVDSARHFLSVDLLKRQIDAMAAAKLNVFHWHLWDDQAIRIQIDSYPKLHQLTGDGQFYTKDDIRDIVAYCQARGIRVVPEISMPGHSSAVAYTYPELMSGPGPYPRQRHWGVFPPLMDPTNPQLYTFLDKVFAEVTALFPDQYLHIGGDEPDYAEWKNNPRIQAYMQANNIANPSALQAHFNARVEKILEKYGKIAMGWDEVLDPNLPKSIVIQSWRGQDSLAQAAKQGYRSVLSTGYYLDQPQPTSYHYRNDPIPKALAISDQLASGESFETYSWEKPRGKGGPRKGTLTIITGSDGKTRAFSDYNGKSRAEVKIVEYEAGKRFKGHFDNFMSYTEFNLDIRDGQFQNGSYQLVGNVRWPTTGKLSAGSNITGSSIPTPPGGLPLSLNASEQKLILGGEAAIWGENYNEETFEQRIWPRSFAAAERLWSAANLDDENSMYQRMAAVDTWSQLSVGLQHTYQRDRMLKRLAGSEDIASLIALSRLLEPAQYYARNWAKFNRGDFYHQLEDLNRYVDALPVESTLVRNMSLQAADVRKGDKIQAARLRQSLQQAQATLEAVRPLLQARAPLADVQTYADSSLEMVKLTLEALDLLAQNRLDADSQTRLLAAVNRVSTHTPTTEYVVALARPLQTLLGK